MKIRSLFFVISLLLVFIPLNAQLKYGIRGGINSSNISLSETEFQVENSNDPSFPDIYEIGYKTGSLGFHLGGLLQYYISDFFIQPELLYTSVKNDIQIVHKTWNPVGDWGEYVPAPETGEQKFNKISLPVLVGYRVGPLRVSAGPMASMMIGTKFSNLEGYTIEQEFESTIFGYQLGLGLELSSLNIDVKYEGALSQLGDGITVRGNYLETNQRMGQWILSVGFVLGDE